MKKCDRKIVAIVGPTASGKTGLGVGLAKKFNGEIVSADSRQIYRGLDLGTGKEGIPAQNAGMTNSEFQISNYKNQTTPLSLLEKKGNCAEALEQLRGCLRYVGGIPQWMIDIKNPEEKFTLFDYLDFARLVIEDIFKRGKTPIIVGGTGLYVQGLVEGFEVKKQETRNNNQTYVSDVISTPQELRAEKSSRFLDYARDDSCKSRYNRDYLNRLTVEELTGILKNIDPEIYRKVDLNNPHRIIRAIERAQSGDRPTKKKPEFKVLQIAIDWPRDVLYDRIDRRADVRFDQGMLEEIQHLLKSGVNAEWLTGLGLEYRIIGQFILDQKAVGFNQDQLDELKKTKEFHEMKQVLKNKSHQYARRQLIWLRRFPEIVWESNFSKIRQMVGEYLKK